MSEDLFLEGLFPKLGPFPPSVVVPPGDDCAAIRIAPGRLLLLAVDQVIAGRHYHDRGPVAATPEQIGRKLAARNLSDVAAMGGRPLFGLVSLAFAPDHDEAWLTRFFDGAIGLGRQFGLHIIGGDLGRTLQGAVASLAILGEVDDTRVCLRSTARPGDLLMSTGVFGDSLASGHHLGFTPRCREGSWLAEHGWARAMIDVSDGLLLDASRLCTASGVGLVLDPTQVPRRTPTTSVDEALTGGEDYELLFATPPDQADRLDRDWPFPDVPLSRLGRFQAGPPRVLGSDGAPLVTRRPPGYDHFR